jgi:ornithine cyclodeaminase/alanine dehydrogenase-like protein (mu-crystallin family)
MAALPDTIRYLSAADVTRLMPPVEQRLELARRAMLATLGDADMPPKNAVHPRPEASFANAMPAFVRGSALSADLMGVKWVAGFPTNRDAGIPQIHGTVLMNDAATGVPTAIMDAGPITAHRTAAVSGVCLAAWLQGGGRPDPTVAIVGAGVQGLSHLEVVAHLAPSGTLRVYDHDRARAELLVERARETGPGQSASVAEDVSTAIAGADVVMTMVSFGPDRQLIPADELASAALVVGVDYDMCVPSGTIEAADRFLVDEVDQFLAFRDTGIFKGYRDPDGTIGSALSSGPWRDRQTVVIHLGIGTTDVVFGDAIARAAEREGIGIELAR